MTNKEIMDQFVSDAQEILRLKDRVGELELELERALKEVSRLKEVVQ